MLGLYYAARRRLRIALRIPPRVRPPPVLSQPLEQVVNRHGTIAQFILKNLPSELDLSGRAVCEIGAGDCLAAASLFLAKGAARVDVVEVGAPVVNAKQWQVLQTLKNNGLPMDLTIIQENGGLHLDSKRVIYHPCYMEHFASENAHQLIFSFSVVEHVEDLYGFYASCWKTLLPGAWMLHVVDLSGHSWFEDPIPPLDFQTYPDWLHDLMFPHYYRATRRFFNQHLKAVVDAGFLIEKAEITRKAETDYVRKIWPKLRKPAQSQSPEDLAVLEFVLVARKQLIGAGGGT